MFALSSFYIEFQIGVNCTFTFDFGILRSKRFILKKKEKLLTKILIFHTVLIEKPTSNERSSNINILKEFDIAFASIIFRLDLKSKPS